MGLIRDLRRLMRATRELPPHPTAREAIRQSADIAEQWGRVADAFAYQTTAAAPSGPGGPYGAATADPFANLAFHQNGLPASGTVIACTPEAQSADGLAVYAVLLEVRIEGREPYRATYRTVIAEAARHNWRQGAVLPFRVSPDDPQALLLG
ncbi:hypothetical protein [Microbacterium sp. MYb64]|uniref:hypothetical protein n=1 Tax=Microbacterium sp. MYb64 TaxID=1848691 RepID=UPI000CFC782B|nr:hypothetical protein [Microbacterium sp. MYb64]PRB09103.1 hypothetical protein CQ044_01770 [Microbacterium sp. MYb64]